MQYFVLTGLFCLGFSSFAAIADNESFYLTQEESVGLVQAVYLNASLTGDEKCWTNKGQVIQKNRLMLEQSEIKVYDEPLSQSPKAINVLISIAAIESTNPKGCSGVVTIEATYNEDVVYYKSRISSLVYLVNRTSIFLSSTKLNQQVLEFTEEVISGFAANVISQRRKPNVEAVIKASSFLDPILTNREIAELLLKKN